MEPEKQPKLRLFEVDYVDPDWRKQVRKVEAIDHEWARAFVEANNHVRRIIRSVNRGPA